MDKMLFIRFFKNASDQIPHDSWPVKTEAAGCQYHRFTDDYIESALIEWMTANPSGKVDFQWL